jgi:hypothetical protein
MSVAVIIPLYKTEPSFLDEISIKQCLKVLAKYPIIVIKPQSLNLDAYPFKFTQIVSFDDRYFSGIEGYNSLMLSPEFYEKFLSYKYILIHQTDALVFKDELKKWCEKGYDYIGAPWLKPTKYPDKIKELKDRLLRYIYIKRNVMQANSIFPHKLQMENSVGNGGFSLRNTRKFYNICKTNTTLIEYYNSIPNHHFNEDTFWGIEVNRKKKQLNIPHYKVAVKFSIENATDIAFKLTKEKLPFGCHAWDNHLNFWRPIFKENGIDIPLLLPE